MTSAGLGKDDAATREAFDKFRKDYGPAKKLDPARIKNSGEVVQMTVADGLHLWKDGAISQLACDTTQPPPTITPDQATTKRLWVVAGTDVPNAQELSEFGLSLASKVVKHSNLVGGGPAYCGGELIFLDANTIVVNGMSGRYGPKTAFELEAAAVAFRLSGYYVWSMGYDTDAGKPLPFVGVSPQWIC